MELLHVGVEHLQSGADEGDVGRVHAAAVVREMLEPPPGIDKGRGAIARAQVDPREEHLSQGRHAALWMHRGWFSREVVWCECAQQGGKMACWAHSAGHRLLKVFDERSGRTGHGMDQARTQWLCPG